MPADFYFRAWFDWVSATVVFGAVSAEGFLRGIFVPTRRATSVCAISGRPVLPCRRHGAHTRNPHTTDGPRLPLTQPPGLPPTVVGAVAWVAIPPRVLLPELRKELLTCQAATVPSLHHPPAPPPNGMPHPSPDAAPPFPRGMLRAAEPATEAAARAGLSPMANSVSLANAGAGEDEIMRHTIGDGGARGGGTWTVEPVAFWRDMGAYVVSLVVILVRLQIAPAQPHGVLHPRGRNAAQVCRR